VSPAARSVVDGCRYATSQHCVCQLPSGPLACTIGRASGPRASSTELFGSSAIVCVLLVYPRIHRSVGRWGSGGRGRLWPHRTWLTLGQPQKAVYLHMKVKRNKLRRSYACEFGEYISAFVPHKCPLVKLIREVSARAGLCGRKTPNDNRVLSRAWGHARHTESATYRRFSTAERSVGPDAGPRFSRTSCPGAFFQ
jgi:hypothetical protein